MVAPQFMSFDNNGMDIQNIVALGADLNYVALQTLDSAGRANETFTWNDWMYETPCWVDDNLNIATRKFAPGEGIWVQGINGYALQTAGQVNFNDVVVKLANGAVAVGNPYPTAIAIQDVVAEGGDLNYVAIQTLDSAGRADETFTWNDWMYETPCWVDDNLDMATRELAPGEGIWVQGLDGYTLRLPAPEL